MRVSQLYAPTLREVPAEAEVISHQLMLRAGMIRKAAGGLYTYLPLAWRVLKKLEAIVREEMDAKGGQELLMPIMQPAELWQESGRWDVYGDEMFRLKDRHDRPFCLGPTHEEMITSLVRSEIRSYKQLPVRLYQIQNKYRDERRPRFGLMRGREFIMKDLYSFDRDEAALDVSYQAMYDAYMNIFTRCGLQFRPVEADSGAIGGSGSHEFMVIADSGEAEIVYCSGCDYAANVEKAPMAAVASAVPVGPAVETVVTPGCKTIREVADFLKVAPAQTIKAVAYRTEKQEIVIALVRGDHEVNDIKVLNECGAIELELAGEVEIAACGSVPGFMGPIGLKKALVIADLSVMEMHDAVCGANEAEKHLLHVEPLRDFKPDRATDIRLIQENDPCPHCGAPVKKARGIEVGQVFKLFTKYSKALNATFLDENGKEKPLLMGCYGVGVSRTMAASIEQNNDVNGIIWPVAIAPYTVIIVPVNTKDAQQLELAETLYAALKQAGVDVLLDDRNERAGVKFKDADLIGYPLRVTVGPKTLEQQQLEVRIRRNGETIFLPLDSYLPEISRLLATVDGSNE